MALAAVDVQLVPVDGAGPHDADLALLPVRERDRLAQRRDPADRHRSAAAHAALRRLLGSRLGRDPADVEVGRSETGALVVGEQGWWASVAHSADLAACALARRPVGVDVEGASPPTDPAALARWCSPAEVRALGRASPTGRDAAVRRAWARKEAVAKALGAGLAVPFADLDVRHALVRVPGRRRPVAVRDVDVGPGRSGAVALDHLWVVVRTRR
ncbi:4'-phosphopantetheinyl transferase superfamily protein [Iamia majanohamensis]|uniref:4'-phosphopantetheinyl transferase superfamily protein n=1 Tax=Iamia majanohamensis TaxID=467976 RepID=A0AAE9Y523_9ACTN|nr:4'-phosphopantetheinyl transferase superfamily protein [Iamia majanohamensis]WCO66785.1 4'-phosphopantetheinyl transferase superfamily protein [Iamia majanohamensis]